MTTTTTTTHRVGLALAGLLSAVSIPSIAIPTPDGEVGPPLAILIVSSLLGVIGLIAVITAWRSGSPVAVRVAAGALIVNVLTALPAFFVDVPAAVKLLTGLSVLLTVLAVTLMFARSSQRMPVVD